jgi:hypothetical protein
MVSSNQQETFTTNLGQSFSEGRPDTIKTSELVKEIVGTNDLLPWTDLMNKLWIGMLKHQQKKSRK